MNRPILLARVEAGPDGRLRVLSPTVGWWRDHLHPGALAGAGSRIGTLEHLNRRYTLVLPDGAAGRVQGPLPRERAVAVEYGGLLFDMAPILVEDREGLLQEARAVEGAAVGVLAAGMHAVLAPTDGVFYRSPSPGAPPFVEVGKRVKTGQAVGLVEVMKTFNHILFGGPGFPGEAEVLEVRVGDVEEVRAGQVLVVVR